LFLDVALTMLVDWNHAEYFSILKDLLKPGGDPQVFSDNTLINGKNNFDCSTKAPGDTTPCVSNAGLAKFKFQTGKTHRLRLINSGSEGVQRFSIDGHTLTVIANDFVPIQPYDTKVVTLGVGQRADVLVTANAGRAGSSFWMRTMQTSCSLAKQPLALATVYYDSDNGKSPNSTAWNVPDPGTCTNDDLALTKPLYKMPLPNPTYTHEYPIALFRNASNVAQWSFDGVNFRGDYNSPSLLLTNLGNTSLPNQWNSRNLYTNSSVRMVVINNTPAP
jgi:FtsP/CotA-like multicopper oxidase with cupredoxin domain